VEVVGQLRALYGAQPPTEELRAVGNAQEGTPAVIQLHHIRYIIQACLNRLQNYLYFYVIEE